MAVRRQASIDGVQKGDRGGTKRGQKFVSGGFCFGFIWFRVPGFGFRVFLVSGSGFRVVDRSQVRRIGRIIKDKFCDHPLHLCRLRPVIEMDRGMDKRA